MMAIDENLRENKSLQFIVTVLTNIISIHPIVVKTFYLKPQKAEKPLIKGHHQILSIRPLGTLNVHNLMQSIK